MKDITEAINYIIEQIKQNQDEPRLRMLLEMFYTHAYLQSIMDYQRAERTNWELELARLRSRKLE